MLSWLSGPVVLLSLVICATNVAAQQEAYPLQPPPSGVATLDRDRLFQDATFGKNVLADIDARSRQLAAENREIEQNLITEEQELTEERKVLSAEEFQAKAVDFDVKVKQIRSEQDSKLTAIRADLDRARKEFAELVDPIIKQLMAEQGIAVIVDQGAVLYAITDIDITDDAILKINQNN